MDYLRSKILAGPQMLPDVTYPAPLPLSREAALEMLSRLDEFDSTGGAFLTFVQIPLEERIGERRFAGTSNSLAQSVERVEQFMAVMRRTAPGLPSGLLQQLLENTAGCEADEYVYPRESPRPVGCSHRVVLSVQYGAPYEGLGVGIVEIEALAGTPFAEITPETNPPEEWQANDAR